MTPVIEARGLWKSFDLVATKQRHLKQTLVDGLLGRHDPSARHVVLRDVELQVGPGESLGVVGRNGSGKTTLLRLLAGIYRPDRGRVFTRGRVATLLELGTGFHMDLTGRENVEIEGILLGLSRRQIARRAGEIVDFAELGEYIDQPVRTYSTGMYMRLAFSVAIHVDPDVLLVDEILSVGDAGFVARCHERVREFQRRGASLVLVTHDAEAARAWCDRALWLSDGRVREVGAPEPVLAAYLHSVEGG
ncbi:MAG: ABC transporter ATP-binding protein [Gemmatimonadota bacterium]